MVRLRAHELLDHLTRPVLVQRTRVWDALRPGVADPARQRLLLTPLGTGTLDGLERGPAELAADSPAGLVRLPAEVVEAEPHAATLILDPARAVFEGRRRHRRLALPLPVRGQPVAGGPPWTSTTIDISAGGALIALALPPDSTHRIVVSTGPTELRVAAATARDAGDGRTALRFTSLTEPAARALAVLLLRAGARNGT